MAISTSVDYVVARDVLIKDALISIVQIAAEDSVPSAVNEHAARQLNLLLKTFQAYGLQLWAIKTGYVIPEADVVEYSLGPSGSHATNSYTTTTLSADAASAATALTVTSIAGISNGDNIGIVLTDGTSQWTTVNGVPSGTTVNITTALTGAAASGNRIYTYTTKLNRPLKIINAQLKDVNGVKTPLVPMSRNEYAALSTPRDEGTPHSYYYDPQLTTGKLFLYPEPNVLTNVVEITYHRPFSDVDAATDDFDFPQEWLLPIQFGLALILSTSYAVPDEVYKKVKSIAASTLDLVLGWDQENTSLRLQPDNQ